MQTNPFNFFLAFPAQSQKHQGWAQAGDSGSRPKMLQSCWDAGVHGTGCHWSPPPRPNPGLLHLGPSLGVLQTPEGCKTLAAISMLTQELSDNKARPFLKYLLLLCLFLSFCVFMHKYAHIYTPTCHTRITLM